MTAKPSDFETIACLVDPIVADRRKVLTYVFLFALSIRLIHLLFLSNAPFFDYLIGDSARYSQWGQEIAAGNWYGDSVFYQAPLYPYFLASIYATLGDSVMCVRLVQSVLGAMSCSMLAAAVWNLFESETLWSAGAPVGGQRCLYV